MRLNELLESGVKRMWADLNGDAPYKDPGIVQQKKKITTRVDAIATKYNIDRTKVQIAWDNSKAEFDPKINDYWAYVMFATKKKLGI
jgi:hypothetical protein